MLPRPSSAPSLLRRTALAAALLCGAAAVQADPIAGLPSFRIQNVHSGKVMSVTYQSMDNNAAITQYADNGTPDHLWQVVDAGGGNVKIRNAHSGKVLAVDGGSKDNAAHLHQYDDNGTSDHLWQLIDEGDGYFRLRSANSGKVMAVDSGSTADGAQLHQWDDNGSADHVWRLLPDGQFKLRNAWSGKVLSVAGASTADMAHVRQYGDNGAADHVWSFLPNADGSFRVRNANSGKVAAVTDQSTDNSAQVTQYSDNGTPDHDWRLRVTPSAPGQLRLQNAHSGKVLAVHGMSQADSAEVEQYDDNGTPDHAWTLVPATATAPPPPAPPAPPAPPGSGEQPPALPQVSSATELGLVGQNASVQCRDGTYSTALNGRSVWIFNDSCLSKTDSNDDSTISNSSPNFISNTLSWATSLDASKGVNLDGDYADADGVLRLFIRPTPGEQQRTKADAQKRRFAIWPGHIINDPARNRVLVFYGAGFGTGISIADGGSGIAVADPGLTQVTRPAQNPDPAAADPSYMWSGSEPAYTSGYLVVNDWLYSYGARGPYTEIHVARVALANVLDKSKWEYWDGASWSDNAAKSAGIYNGGAAGDQLYYDQYLGEYVTVYQPFQSDDVLFRVAKHPEGPWSQPGKLFTTRQGVSTSYAARVHAEFEEGGGATEYVSYVLNTSVNAYGVPMQSLPLVKVTFKRP